METLVRSWPGYGRLECKRSRSWLRPFRRWKVALRPQAVSAGSWSPGFASTSESHLDPAAWQARFQKGDALVLDVRNDYEAKVGYFPGAVQPMTRNFADLEEFVKSWDVPKDTTILTYCTGGIRCEKAVPLLQRAGFQEVYQLHGGILSYFEQFGQGHYQGECYVFDERVAVGADLLPATKWTHCPVCGDAVSADSPCSRCQG